MKNCDLLHHGTHIFMGDLRHCCDVGFLQPSSLWMGPDHSRRTLREPNCRADCRWCCGCHYRPDHFDTTDAHHLELANPPNETSLPGYRLQHCYPVSFHPCLFRTGQRAVNEPTKPPCNSLIHTLPPDPQSSPLYVPTSPLSSISTISPIVASFFISSQSSSLQPLSW